MSKWKWCPEGGCPLALVMVRRRREALENGPVGGM